MYLLLEAEAPNQKGFRRTPSSRTQGDSAYVAHNKLKFSTLQVLFCVVFWLTPALTEAQLSLQMALWVLCQGTVMVMTGLIPKAG